MIGTKCATLAAVVWLTLAACGGVADPPASTTGTNQTEDSVGLATENDLADDEALLTRIVERAEELGATISPEDVRLTALPTDTVPGMRVFRGLYTYLDMRDAVTGIVTDRGEIVALPLDALERVFAAWEEAGGIPDASTVAEVVAFVIGGAGPNEVVLTDDDVGRLGGAHADLVTTPRSTANPTGVVFWWDTRAGGLEEVNAYLDDGFLEIERRSPDQARD